MGRRKIEIQPITHERNRSVTFLKRKNGLFKKAYELGVLCSVDVAVIIFEEKPGHNVKLYQYCSDDIKNIVQRHAGFDGENDTKVPADFNNSKPEEGADGEEDEVDQAEDPASRSKKRTESGAIKAPASKEKADVKPEATASSSRTTNVKHEQDPSPSGSGVRLSPSGTGSGERSSRHSPEHDDYSANKRARLGSYPDELRAAEARAFAAHSMGVHGIGPHGLHPYALASSAFGPQSAFSSLFSNPAAMGGQPGNVFDFLRNPANMRAFGPYPPHPQGAMYPPRPPPNVSEAFLASLSEVAAQQGGVGCGVGGVGAGVSGFEWPAGYPTGLHHSDQTPEASWLDFLTGAPPSNIAPPSHLHLPHAHDYHQWSSASSTSSRRSDSSMSNGPLGALGMGESSSSILPPSLSGRGGASSPEGVDGKGIL